MGEEVQMSDYGSAGEDEEQDRMVDWEVGLPGSQDLAPLSQGLIPPELAIAFNIKPAPCRTLLEVNRASQNTLSSIRRQTPTTLPRNGFKSFTETNGYGGGEGKIIVEEEEERSDVRKIRRIDNNRSGIGCAAEEADSRLDDSNSADDDNNNYTDSDINNNNCSNNNNDNNNQNQSAKTLKRPRLVWTPQLHKRFVDVVGHLGIKNAVPKTIMQLMNVEGLTRENVASHLQKYRLYLKRMHVGGIGDGDYSGGGPSSSDMFATTPVHQSLHEGGSSSGGNGHMGMPIAVPYGGHHPIMPVPIMGMGGHHGGHGHMGMVPQGYGNGFESLNHHYHHHGHGMQQNHSFHQPQRHGMMQQRQRDWIGAYNGSHPHVASHDK